MDEPKTKICKTASKYRIACGKEKPIEEFRLQYNPGRERPYRTAICRDCERESARLFGRTDQSRNARYKRRFGTTLAEYNRMFEAQRGLCAICKVSAQHERNNGHVNLCIDHEHTEEKFIRGLLCQTCNRGVGNIGDTLELIEAAAEYLRAAKARKEKPPEPTSPEGYEKILEKFSAVY